MEKRQFQVSDDEAGDAGDIINMKDRQAARL